MQALRAAGRSTRAWLWTSVGNDAVCFHIDPSRSAAAAQTLFGELRSGTVLVCDRCRACKKLARLRGGTVILQFCWAHMRRDFIPCAAGQAGLAGWCAAWLERIAALCRLNAARLVCHEPRIERQSAAFDAAQEALAAAVGTLNLNGIDARRWLEAWLAARASNGGRPPRDTAPWLPWSMDDARRREPAAPT